MLRVTATALSLSVGLCAQDPTPIGPLSAEAAIALRTAVLPSDCETWETIPWRIDLASARDEARQRGRPLFLWTMNGHPLGCT